MAKYHRTEGLCLRRVDYSNTSQVASFLTRDRGTLSFMAKGVTRAPRRGIRRGFDLLGRYELIWTERRSGALLNLTGRSLLEGFRGLRRAVERMLCAYYVAELALNFAAEDQPCRRLYELALQSLRRFETGESLGLCVLLLEIGVLQQHGACPTFEACAECERALPPTGRLLFSASQGGALCRACSRRLHRGPGARTLPVQAGDLALLADLAARPPARPERLSADPRQIVAASRLLRFHTRDLLGKELKMWKYLQERHLSRELGRIRGPARTA